MQLVRYPSLRFRDDNLLQDDFALIDSPRWSSLLFKPLIAALDPSAKENLS